MDKLDVGHYVRSKEGAGQPRIEGYIAKIEGDVARIDVRRIGQAKVSRFSPEFRTRSLRNLERGEL